MTHVNQIAAKFSQLLADHLTREQHAEMINRNFTSGYAGACASHDFCDANEVMAEAFQTVTGREPDPADDADATVWNAAWSAARANYIGSPSS